jgi:hypothetical protein
VELARTVERLGFRALTTTRYSLVEHEVKQLLLENGMSYVWRLTRVQETVLPRTVDMPALVGVLRGMLKRIEPTEELIIIDRYLLPKQCPDCVDILMSAITPVLDRIKRLVVVVSQSHDPAHIDAIRNRLKGGKCELVCRASEAFHDRFWIADRKRALFVGTSLNGLGKRYALADYMDAEDVRDIIEAVVTERLL